jgi:hypothetical protein
MISNMIRLTQRMTISGDTLNVHHGSVIGTRLSSLVGGALEEQANKRLLASDANG